MKHPERRYEVGSMSDEDYARFEGFMAKYNSDIDEALKKAKVDGTVIWYYEVTEEDWKMLMYTPVALVVAEKDIISRDAVRKAMCSDMGGFLVVLGDQRRVVFDGIGGEYYSDDKL